MNNPIPVDQPFVQHLTAKDHQGGAIAGNYLSMNYASQIALIINVGNVAQATTLQVQQATDASGTSAKAIELAAGSAFTTSAATKNPVVDDTLLSSGDIVIPTDGDDKVYVVVVHAEDLDVNNGFDHIAVTGSDPGGAFVAGCVATSRPCASSYSDGEPGLRGA